jgi:hypothetical protein
MAIKNSDFLQPAPPEYKWPRCPEADGFVDDTIRVFLEKHAFAHHLAERMRVETSTLFPVWVDHILLPAKSYSPKTLATLGFWEDKKVRRPSGAKVFYHPYADLPRLVVSARIKEIGCAIMVDNIWRFQLAHRLSLPIDGAPYSAYRSCRLTDGLSDLFIVERRGSLTLVPEARGEGQTYLACFERWMTRPRAFESDAQGMKETLKLAKEIVKDVGTGPAATLFLDGERVYWQSRNRAAHVQKTRQDELGLGWANHDHHTFRSSRSQFPTLINILLTFGFKKRERYYAGKDAGWGAQIMEQPEAGVIIFADVDLAPEDVSVDFSKIALPDLQKPGTVGLWCALHGESMLQAGMHHLEAKFDFDQLKRDLQEKNVETMPPFSDFSFLRQAFTKAEMWRVSEPRLSHLLGAGKISGEAYAQIKEKGAVGSHMENLQRREGFKGFNQKGVSEIIAAVNPEKQAVSGHSGLGAA